MLIIPAERGIDWRRAPVMTCALIMVCCLVFFGWQWSDEERLYLAAEYYTEHGLLDLEYPNYISHLHQTGRELEAAEFESAWSESERVYLSYAILADLSFTVEMDKTDARFWGEDVYDDWRSARSEVNTMVAEVSAFKLGLIPADSRVITYLTYQFMHGSTMHLIGNMVILALTGVAVEAAIGSTYFVLCYLFCGIVAGLAFTLFNWSAHIPLVGASGSISGVMGMYAALYGLRKIKFFYSIIFYFGYFTAPALVMLPVWLGWELINAIWGGNDGVAYIAHAGGLLAGGLGMLVGRKYLVQVEETYLDQAPDEDEEYRRSLDDYLKQLATFNFDAAQRKLAQLEAQYPQKNAVLEQRYFLEKLQPHTDRFHTTAHQLLSMTTQDTATMHMLHDVYRDYLPLMGEHSLPDETLLKLMLQFCQIEAWETVTSMVKQAQQRRLREPMLVKVLRLLARGINERGERHLSNQFRDMADSLEQSLQQT
ncbi:rhomboid family intramembrane serine protease [Ketobacter sp.]|uniref:rhomboid family intramembrane serine protease n=1 Tax=Ketobacter sp. TaxID=2083498 RepID=UPI000F2A89E1|nr:rhomboid family intramembrane serine protease [Ketobacter sp.]RLT92484.1 MAG: rhomboid family intramembrane serine protease [Ketobacter sp.]